MLVNPGLHLAGQLSIALDECLKTGRIQLRVDMKPLIVIQPMDEGCLLYTSDAADE